MTAIFFQVATNMYQEGDIADRGNNEEEQRTNTNGNGEEG
jgi:hypothetical protein